MIARNSPIRSGWPTAGILIALAVTRLAGQTAINAPEQDAEGRVRTVNPNSESIAEAIAVLRTTDIRDSKRWAKAAFDLVQIGKPAVPALIEELDRTTENRPLRSLGFTLRAIGDPRAVPALIARSRGRSSRPAAILGIQDQDVLPRKRGDVPFCHSRGNDRHPPSYQRRD